ncbi:retrotransposon gag family protein, partial [Providencia rettgeri]
LVRRVAGHHPPFYAGEEDPAVHEEWIRAFDKILQAVECPPGRQVEMASFYLKEEADLWWVHGGPVMRQEPGFGWETFKDRLRARFYPAHVKAAMQEEFLHLKQGSRTVQEYHRHFLELARFAPTLAPTEETRIERFVAGLNLDTRMALVVFKF